MKIDSGVFTAEIRDVSSAGELIGAIAQIEQTCLLIVYPGSGFIADEQLPSGLPFLTALAVSEGQSFGGDVTGMFDMILSADEAGEFTQRIFKDKTPKQAAEITACFTAARNSSEDALKRESIAFYRLMAEKNGGSADE